MGYACHRTPDNRACCYGSEELNVDKRKGIIGGFQKKKNMRPALLGWVFEKWERREIPNPFLFWTDLIWLKVPTKCANEQFNAHPRSVPGTWSPDSVVIVLGVPSNIQSEWLLMLAPGGIKKEPLWQDKYNKANMLFVKWVVEALPVNTGVI